MQQHIAKDIYYVGANDRSLRLFEGMFPVSDGVSYNSYVILDKEIAVMDSVDLKCGEEWLKKIDAVCDGRTPKYLIVQHMEPDHSANIHLFVRRYPDSIVVASAPAFHMMKNFFGTDFEGRNKKIKEGDTLCLGKHTLTFFDAPMVHWPEVMVTYDSYAKALFSADGFGKFGALDTEEEWECEARRYYFGIIGRFGKQVTELLNKIRGLELSLICPLHGPVLHEPLARYLLLYEKWASYEPEEDGIVIAFSSIYDNTRNAVRTLCASLEERGHRATVHDLSQADMSEVVEDAFRYSKLVLAAPTYNGGVFPPMRELISCLVERNFQNRTVALIENGSWAPMAAKTMREMLEDCRHLSFTKETVSIRSALDRKAVDSIAALAKELTEPS